MRRKILDYLRSLPLCIRVTVAGNAYLLVHGAPAESYDGDPKYQNRTHFAVWKRLSLYDSMPDGSTVIFGHTPTRYYQDSVPMEIWAGEDRIGIDCGSGYPESGPDCQYGRLACLRLDDGCVFYSQETAEL